MSYIGACESGADFRSLPERGISPTYILLSTTKNRGLIIFIDEPSVLSAIPVNPKWSCIVSRSAVRFKLGHSSVRFLRIRCNRHLSNIESHSLVWCSTFHWWNKLLLSLFVISFGDWVMVLGKVDVGVICRGKYRICLP